MNQMTIKIGLTNIELEMGLLLMSHQSEFRAVQDSKERHNLPFHLSRVLKVPIPALPYNLTHELRLKHRPLFARYHDFNFLTRFPNAIPRPEPSHEFIHYASV